MRRTVAVLLLMVGAGRGFALSKAWHNADDFLDGKLDAVTVYPQGTGARAGIGLALQSVYSPDPTETTGLTFWSKNPTNLQFLPYAVYGHGVVVVGDWIYTLGGIIHITPATLAAGGCGLGGGGTYRTVASVFFHHIDPNGDIVGPWTLANYELAAQESGSGLGIIMSNFGVVAVGNRIYISGGTTMNVVAPQPPNALPATRDVYSTEVDPLTGQTGPWRTEISLLQTAKNHGMVYAGGALFVLGGMLPDGNTPGQIVQKAEINPADGRLYNSNGLFWAPARSIPPGNPPGSCALCSLCSCSACAPCDEACCRALDICLGWVWISPFSVMRTIGFVGGAYANGVSGNACKQFHGTYHSVLDDCNNLQDWTVRDATLGLFGAGVIVNDGSLLQVGGGDGSALTKQALFNSYNSASGSGTPGLVRDTSTPDAAELRPADPDGTELIVKPATNYEFALAATALTGISHNEWAYVVGGAMTNTTEPCQWVYRALMASTSIYVSAGSFVSRPYDLGGSFKLSRVAWSYTKTGSTTPDGNPDDWAMVRYRVASADGVWTCWSPRFPEEASMPGTPGYYTYSSDAASILTREPLIPDLFRYVQFEVSLYNDPRGDGAGLTVPRFDEFRIDYDPALPPKPVSGQLELFPNPARDMVNVRFQVDPAGAEVKARIYNVAAHLVSQDSYNYLSGGIKQEAIRVEGLSAGAYVIVLEALGHGGGPGFYDPKTGERVKRIKAKFVVRR